MVKAFLYESLFTPWFPLGIPPAHTYLRVYLKFIAWQIQYLVRVV
jgi:hypothetical protein